MPEADEPLVQEADKGAFVEDHEWLPLAAPSTRFSRSGHSTIAKKSCNGSRMAGMTQGWGSGSPAAADEQRSSFSVWLCLFQLLPHQLKKLALGVGVGLVLDDHGCFVLERYNGNFVVIDGSD